MALPAVLAALGALGAGQDLGEELRRLNEHYEKERSVFFEAEGSAGAEEEKKRIRTRFAESWIPRFKDLARRASGDDVGAAALLGALNVGWDLEDSGIVREIVEALAAGYADSATMGKLAPYLQGGMVRGWTWSRTALRSLSERVSHPKARMELRFSLGCALLRDPGASAEDQNTGRKILEDFRKNHPGTGYAGKAESELFEFDHLRVGCTPPDFEATDQDGHGFRLSDYRGKVVVLAFWGFW